MGTRQNLERRDKTRTKRWEATVMLEGHVERRKIKEPTVLA